MRVYMEGEHSESIHEERIVRVYIEGETNESLHGGRE